MIQPRCQVCGNKFWHPSYCPYSKDDYIRYSCTAHVREVLDKHLARYSVLEDHNTFKIWMGELDDKLEFLLTRDLNCVRVLGIMITLYSLPWWQNWFKRKKWKRLA